MRSAVRKANLIAYSHEYDKKQLRTVAAAPVEVHAVRNTKKKTLTYVGQATNQRKKWKA